jgi:uncharacterized protein (TIGR02266 family)
MLVDYQCGEGVRCDYATTLGAGGLFLESESLVEPGTTVKLRFRLPHSEELHDIQGRVTWTRGAHRADRSQAPGMGVQFTDPAARAKLARELDHMDE